jgi:hypothetical protein
VSPQFFNGTGMLFLAFVVLQLLRFTLPASRVDFEVLCAGITIYLMLGLFRSLAYSLVDRLFPDSFAFNVGTASGRSMQGSQALYFSFITLSTIGYGDIVPVSKVALPALKCYSATSPRAIACSKRNESHQLHPPEARRPPLG